MNIQDLKTKSEQVVVALPWKTGVLAPADANRPNCKVICSYDGTLEGRLEEDETDLVDWLVVIAYETNLKAEHGS